MDSRKTRREISQHKSKDGGNGRQRNTVGDFLHGNSDPFFNVQFGTGPKVSTGNDKGIVQSIIRKKEKTSEEHGGESQRISDLLADSRISFDKTVRTQFQI